METNDYHFYILCGIVAFNFCLNLATLMFVFYLWIDIYHRKWLRKMDKIETELEKMRMK